MFTAEEAGAVLGRDLWSEGPSQLSGGGPTNVVAHLFASHCQEEIKENLPLPSGPMGWDGGGGRRGGEQWRGRAITRGPNCCHQQSPVSSAQSALIGLNSS